MSSNAIKLKSVFLISIAVLLSSCCTKKDCDGDVYPEIHVAFENFNTHDLQKITLYLADKESFELIDSVDYTDRNHVVIDQRTLQVEDRGEMKAFAYIIKTASTLETIRQISYEMHPETIDCNTCFPVGDGTETIQRYKDFSYWHRQIEYNGENDLVIEKQ